LFYSGGDNYAIMAAAFIEGISIPNKTVESYECNTEIAVCPAESDRRLLCRSVTLP
jgi:hypothetical protein